MSARKRRGVSRFVTLVGLGLNVAAGGCHRNAGGGAHFVARDAGQPCRAARALEALAEFQHRVIEPLGLSGEGLYSGGKEPGRLRDLARLVRKTAKKMGTWSSGDPKLDRLWRERVEGMQKIGELWDRVADALEADDHEAFQRSRERLIELRARDLSVRKQLRRMYEACGLPSPF